MWPRGCVWLVTESSKWVDCLPWINTFGTLLPLSVLPLFPQNQRGICTLGLLPRLPFKLDFGYSFGLPVKYTHMGLEGLRWEPFSLSLDGSSSHAVLAWGPTLTGQTLALRTGVKPAAEGTTAVMNDLIVPGGLYPSLPFSSLAFRQFCKHRPAWSKCFLFKSQCRLLS
jgi:hypothetical protein